MIFLYFIIKLLSVLVILLLFSKVKQQLEYCVKPAHDDVWSSLKLRNVSREDRKNKVFITLCCDKTQFHNDSWTPLVLRVLNFSPEVRVHKDAMITLAGTQKMYNPCINCV